MVVCYGSPPFPVWFQRPLCQVRRGHLARRLFLWTMRRAFAASKARLPRLWRCQLRGSAKFCSQCRTPIGQGPEKATPVDGLNRWKRPAGEYACRTEAADLHATLQPGLVVEPGTQALIFQAGSLAAAVSEGTFDLARPLPGVDMT